MYFSNIVQLNVEPVLSLDPYFYTGGRRDKYFNTNIIYRFQQLDGFFPIRTFLDLGGE